MEDEVKPESYEPKPSIIALPEVLLSADSKGKLLVGRYYGNALIFDITLDGLSGGVDAEAQDEPAN